MGAEKGGGGGWVSEFFLRGSKSKIKKTLFWGREGGRGRARVSEFSYEESK